MALNKGLVRLTLSSSILLWLLKPGQQACGRRGLPLGSWRKLAKTHLQRTSQARVGAPHSLRPRTSSNVALPLVGNRLAALACQQATFGRSICLSLRRQWWFSWRGWLRKTLGTQQQPSRAKEPLPVDTACGQVRFVGSRFGQLFMGTGGPSMRRRPWQG